MCMILSRSILASVWVGRFFRFLCLAVSLPSLPCPLRQFIDSETRETKIYLVAAVCSSSHIYVSTCAMFCERGFPLPSGIATYLGLSLERDTERERDRESMCEPETLWAVFSAVHRLTILYYLADHCLDESFPVPHSAKP
ncbi:hypothetical protein F4775DRAFT_277422 [Biscogniauxia sp. FL1348]|nr:hypothetical protein F4775DRAFT_277422 [Biscogniauxia sp. FL1348]